MELCDRLRDEDLVELGVAVDDQPGQSRIVTLLRMSTDVSLCTDGHALVKLVPRDTLIRAREEKQAAAAVKAAKAEEKRVAAENLARQKAESEAKDLEMGRSTIKEYFAAQTDKYSRFDEEGLPSHDAAGEPLAKSAIKRLKKEADVQTKRREKYLKSQSA